MASSEKLWRRTSFGGAETEFRSRADECRRGEGPEVDHSTAAGSEDGGHADQKPRMCHSDLSAMASTGLFPIAPTDSVRAARLTRGIQAQEMVPCASMSRWPCGEVS
jgi:hypothetical protein